MTKAERAALADLDAIRRHYVGRDHPIVPVDLTGTQGFRSGRCAACGRAVYESGDYREDRYRHKAAPR